MPNAAADLPARIQTAPPGPLPVDAIDALVELLLDAADDDYPSSPLTPITPP